MTRKAPKLTNIPSAEAKLTEADKRKAVYGLYVDLTKHVKIMLKDTSIDSLHGLIKAHLTLLTPPEGVDEVTLPIEALKQTVLLANQAVARQLYERSK